MKVRNLMKGKRGLCGFMAGILALLLLFACLPACAPAAEEEAPPVEEEGPYEAYVSSLPEGCFPVPQDCFEQAMDEGEFYKYCWGEWWPAELREGFAQEFGIKVTKDDYGDIDEMVTKFRLYTETAYDIGKSMVVSFLQANGFEVYDVGRDVEIQKFIHKAQEVDADIIGMSALLTTTMSGQKTLIQELKKAGLRDRFKVMVGGAPVTQRWADRIGADAYGVDAADAARKAMKLLGEE